MTRFSLTILLLAAMAMLATTALAQNFGDFNMGILAKKLKADKKQVVAMNMDLNRFEAMSFWPLYDTYQVQLRKMNQRINTIRREDTIAYSKSGLVPDPIAQKLIEAVLVTEIKELKIKLANYRAVESVLPAVKVARYMQIESKIRAIEKLGIASEVPLVY